MKNQPIFYGIKTNTRKSSNAYFRIKTKQKSIIGKIFNNDLESDLLVKYVSNELDSIGFQYTQVDKLDAAPNFGIQSFGMWFTYMPNPVPFMCIGTDEETLDNVFYTEKKYQFEFEQLDINSIFSVATIDIVRLGKFDIFPLVMQLGDHVEPNYSTFAKLKQLIVANGLQELAFINTAYVCGLLNKINDQVDGCNLNFTTNYSMKIQRQTNHFGVAFYKAFCPTSKRWVKIKFTDRDYSKSFQITLNRK